MSDVDIDELAGSLRAVGRGTLVMWCIGFLALLAGGFLLDGYPGAIIAIGVTFIALAAAQEIKMQIYPIGLLALKRTSDISEE